jgi:hypothetical protein
MLLSFCDEYRTQSYGSWMGLMGRVEKNCIWFPTRMSLVAMDTKTRSISFGLRRPTPPRLGGSRLTLFLVSEDKLRTVNDLRGLMPNLSTLLINAGHLIVEAVRPVTDANHLSSPLVALLSMPAFVSLIQATLSSTLNTLAMTHLALSLTR